jgi:hypothetical protein
MTSTVRVSSIMCFDTPPVFEMEETKRISQVPDPER